MQVELEIELKFRNDDPTGLRERLVAMGACDLGQSNQEDEYLIHPSRDFAVSGEALRIRKQGGKADMTYKSATRTGTAKTRQEIEAGFDSLASCDAAREILFKLGFRSLAVVRKHRWSFQLNVQNRSMKIELDRVDSLGNFAEVETKARVDEQQAAEEAIGSLARNLGLEELVHSTYLALLLEAYRD